MASSDSESENECFESAEESLDEEDSTSCEKIKCDDDPCEFKPEVQSSVESSNELSQTDENLSSASLSYRKRPERLKRSTSMTQTKSIPKSSSSELSFKSEIIAPDVFLQDITSNLSKNINKSLNTLQQKSSNVKDLILNSLPVPSNNESEKFSYDDKYVVDDETAESNLENSQKDAPLYDFKNVVEGNSSAFEKIETKASEAIFSVLDKISGNVRNSKPKHLFNPDNLEPSKTSICNPPVDECKYTSNDEIVETFSKLNSDDTETDLSISNENVVSKTAETPDVLSFNEKSQANFVDSSKENASNQESLQKGDAVRNEYKNMSLLSPQETEDFVIKECAVDNLEVMKSETPKKTDDSRITDDVKNKFNETDSLIDKFKFDDNNLQRSLKDMATEHNNCKNNRQLDDAEDEIPKENYVKEKEECIVSSHNLTKQSRHENKVINCESKDADYSKNVATDSVTPLMLEECINSVEKIIEETAGNGQNISFSSSDDPNFLENEAEVNENSNDGWDDFDFSEDENDSSKLNELKDSKMFKDKKTEAEKIKTIGKADVVKPGSFSSSEKPVLKDCPNTRSASETKTLTQDLKAPTLSDDFKQTSVNEINSDSNDGWDWDDWGNSEDTEEKMEDKASNKQLNFSNKENVSEISGWSGWDTFGQKAQEKQGNWGLGSWGVDMILNKASAVTQGISNVLEAGLGAPDPETLARMEKMALERVKENDEKEIVDERSHNEISKKSSLPNVTIFPVSGITSLVAGVTSKIVEHSKIQEIGSKVITGGLDTLETFGKKTMEVLQEGDPGLKNKRALLLGQNKPVLSQVLKEAREKADKELKRVEEKESARKCHFETLFDDFQGMVHLEALEMLSTQCELKLDQMKSGMNSEELEDLTGILDEVEQLCCLDECDFDANSSVVDFKTQLQMAVEPLKNEISVLNIIQIHESVNKWLKLSLETSVSFMEIQQKLVSTIAELAAATVHQFHKSGELLSVKECRKTVEEVDSLLRLTNILCNEINKLCDKFIKLHESKNQKGSGDENLKEKVTLVMNNSTSYIKQAFNLLIPVIQLGAAV